MCYDVIPLVCRDWCILAASFALAGGGGVGIGGRGGEGLHFPQIETSKCEESPAWGRLRARANALHTCNTVNVPARSVRSVLIFQRRSWAEDLGNGFDWDTMGGKTRLWLCTFIPSSLWALLHIKAEGRRREEGIMSGRISVSPIVQQTCWDELNGEPPPSCQWAKWVLGLQWLCSACIYLRLSEGRHSWVPADRKSVV